MLTDMASCFHQSTVKSKNLKVKNLKRGVSRRLLYTLPGLRSAEERHAYVSANIQLVGSLNRHFTAIRCRRLRVVKLSSRIVLSSPRTAGRSCEPRTLSVPQRRVRSFLVGVVRVLDPIG